MESLNEQSNINSTSSSDSAISRHMVQLTPHRKRSKLYRTVRLSDRSALLSIYAVTDNCFSMSMLVLACSLKHQCTRQSSLCDCRLLVLLNVQCEHFQTMYFYTVVSVHGNPYEGLACHTPTNPTQTSTLLLSLLLHV